jgi:hypothetical protein
MRKIQFLAILAMWLRIGTPQFFFMKNEFTTHFEQKISPQAHMESEFDVFGTAREHVIGKNI